MEYNILYEFEFNRIFFLTVHLDAHRENTGESHWHTPAVKMQVY